MKTRFLILIERIAKNVKDKFLLVVFSANFPVHAALESTETNSFFATSWFSAFNCSRTKFEAIIVVVCLVHANNFYLPGDFYSSWI